MLHMIFALFACQSANSHQPGYCVQLQTGTVYASRAACERSIPYWVSRSTDTGGPRPRYICKGRPQSDWE